LGRIFYYFSFMKKTATLILLAFFAKVCSQNLTSKDFEKVEFIYSQKSNCEFDEKGVYADTIVFKTIFPDLSYSFKTSPKNKNKKLAYVPYFALNSENIGKLRGHLYHSNISIEATYNKKNKKTEYYAYYCPDEEFQNLIIFLKGTPCDRNRSEKVSIDYSDNRHIKTRGRSLPKKEIAKSVIEYSNDTILLGTYLTTTKKITFSNIVEFDENLNKFITPIDIFANSDFGVKKVTNPFVTIDLISISYN